MTLNTYRPKYERAHLPPAMQFQARDGVLLKTIYEFDSVVAKRQLKHLFWPDATWRAMEKRLSLLYHNGYLDWPTQTERRHQPIPEPICWLGWKGILWLAGEQGVPVRAPSVVNESQLRKMEQDLRAQEIRWVRAPRWTQLTHDLAILDVRLNILDALKQQPRLSLEEWVSESTFASHADLIYYDLKDKNNRQRRQRRYIRPDGYFVIRDNYRAAKGEPAQARFLLELDNGTHDIGSFGREKVVPGAAYLKSDRYRVRFGDTSGRWLVITTGGERRLASLMSETLKVAGQDAALFWFSTRQPLEGASIFTSPIWQQAGVAQPFALIPPTS